MKTKLNLFKTIIHLALVFSALFNFSCRSQEESVAPNSEIELSFSIEEAKYWYENNFNLPKRFAKNQSNTDTIKIDWESATTTIHEDKQVIVASVNNRNSKAKLGSLTKYLFIKDRNNQIKLQIAKAIGDAIYMKKVNYRIGLNNFSGITVIEDIEGNFIRGEYYVDGKIVAKLNDFSSAEGTSNNFNTLQMTNSYRYVLVTVDRYQEVFIDGVSYGTTYLGTYSYYKLVYESSNYDDIYGTFYSSSGDGNGGGQNNCPYGPNCTNPAPIDHGDIIVDIEVVRPATVEEVIIKEIEDDYNKRLNDCEKQLIYKHTYKAYPIYSNAQKATNKTIALFGPNANGNNYNDCGDAFRHAYWNALNARSVGGPIAKEFGDAHECGSTNSYETSMDLHNNSIGVQIGSNNLSLDDNAIADLVLQALRNGQLKVLSPLGQNNAPISSTRTIESNLICQ